MRALAIVAAVAILGCHLLGIYALAGRPMHYDENEYMHTSWLMAAGKRIYRDFFEDHPPHLGIVLNGVRPAGDLHSIDVRAWTIRARLLSGAFGTLAVLAIMLFAWRMTRSPAAPVVAAAMLLASSQMWSRGLTDIRAEAFTLALFWWGVVLVTWSRDASYRAGVGIGLAFFANVWNPKWPLEGAFLGVLYIVMLWRARREPRALISAIVPAIVIAAVALLPLFSVTTPRDFFFFNFQFKAAVVSDFASSPWIVRFFEQYPLWQTASPQHRWWIIIPAIVLAVISTANRQLPTANRRLAWIAIALAVCALVELRFVYPYPYLWAQYLVMVATTASLVYALLASHSRVISAIALVGATLFALVRLQPLVASVFAETPASWTRYWSGLRAMQTDQPVWISPPRHPVAAFDASYYWYNFRESVPSMIRARERYPELIPAIGFEDLPPCTLNARYVEIGDWVPYLDGVCHCVERNHARLNPTPSLAIFEVGGTPRIEPWHERTRGLWSDLCRRQEVFLRGGQLNISP